MKKTFLLLFTLALFWNCAENPFENHSLSLSGEAGVTEAWLEVRVEGLKPHADYILQRDGRTVFSGRLQTQDTVLYDSLLSPSTTYRYRLYAREGGDLSPAAETGLTTLDTTSHDFSWQTFEFGGQGGSSIFYDVAIIDENDIWAVGKIYTTDNKYNAAHWDGEKWTLVHVNGNSSPIHVILAFAKDDIWFQGLLHWDGQKYTRYKENFPLMPNGDGWRMNKMWGTSSRDFYVVGNNGMMAHYNGTRWTKIDTGTEENIQDIWGVISDKTGISYVLCAASQVYQNSEKLIFNVKPDNTISKLDWSFNDRKPYSVWHKNPKKLFSCGDGIFTLGYKGKWKIMTDEIPYFMNRIRGTDINDVYVVGAFGLISHFNGTRWKTLPTRFNGSYNSIDISEKKAVAVGYDNRKALITMMKKGF